METVTSFSLRVNSATCLSSAARRSSWLLPRYGFGILNAQPAEPKSKLFIQHHPQSIVHAVQDGPRLERMCLFTLQVRRCRERCRLIDSCQGALNLGVLEAVCVPRRLRGFHDQRAICASHRAAKASKRGAYLALVVSSALDGQLAEVASLRRSSVVPDQQPITIWCWPSDWRVRVP